MFVCFFLCFLYDNDVGDVFFITSICYIISLLFVDQTARNNHYVTMFVEPTASMDMLFPLNGLIPLPSLASSTASKNMRLVEKDLTCPAPLLSFRKAVVNGSKQKYSLESLFLGSGNDVETHFEIFRTSTFSADAKKKRSCSGFPSKRNETHSIQRMEKNHETSFLKQDGKPHRTNS